MEEFIVVLNGPLAGFCLFLFARFLIHNFTFTNPAIDLMVKFAAIVNAFWTIINLIPVLPLDGGHLMSIILEAIFGFRGVKIAVVIGLIISICISIYFFVIQQFFVGALFLILTFESFRSLKYFKMLTEKDRDSDLQELMRSADKDFQQKHYEDALTKLQTVRDKTQQGVLYCLATEEMADIYRHQDRLKEAYALLLPIKNQLSPESIPLFHFLAYSNDDWDRVIEYANKCYQNNPKGDTALMNAAAYASKAQVEPAIGWLECAQREGAKINGIFLQQEAFDPIRKEPHFQEFMNSLKKR